MGFPLSNRVACLRRKTPSFTLIDVLRALSFNIFFEVTKMEKEKDNFWLYIGGLIVVTIVLVVMLKSREMEVSGAGEAQAQLKSEVDKQLSKAK